MLQSFKQTALKPENGKTFLVRSKLVAEHARMNDDVVNCSGDAKSVMSL